MQTCNVKVDSVKTVSGAAGGNQRKLAATFHVTGESDTVEECRAYLENLPRVAEYLVKVLREFGPTFQTFDRDISSHKLCEEAWKALGACGYDLNDSTY